MSDWADLGTSTRGIGSTTGRAVGTRDVDSNVQVVVGGITITAQCARDLSPGVGDILLLIRTGSVVTAVARVGAVAVDPPDEEENSPAPNPPSRSGILVMHPVAAGSWSGVNGRGARAEGDNLIQGTDGRWQARCGAAYYSTVARCLDGATVDSAKLWVKRSAGAGVVAVGTITLLPELSAPITGPDVATFWASRISTSALAVGQSEDLTIPTSWIDSMIAGNAAGIGCYVAGDTPYIEFAGRTSWARSFVLVVNWTRG
jgi:hypothetical protein